MSRDELWARSNGQICHGAWILAHTHTDAHKHSRVHLAWEQGIPHERLVVKFFKSGTVSWSRGGEACLDDWYDAAHACTQTPTRDKKTTRGKKRISECTVHRNAA